MRTVQTAGLVVLALASAPLAAAPKVSIVAESPAAFRVEVEVDPAGMPLLTTKVDGVSFVSLGIEEGLSFHRAGQPDVPVIHRLLAVDPGRHYQVEVSLAGRVTVNDVVLMPAQPDTPDTGAVPAFALSLDAYRVDDDLGKETVALGERARIGQVTLLPLRITPFHYNPAKRQLTIWRKVTARVFAKGASSPRFAGSGAVLTPFQSAQVKALAENAGAVVQALRPAEAPRYLIVTSEYLAPKAREFAASGRNPGVAYEVVTVDPTKDSLHVKSVIQQAYDRGALDTVLIFGDEKHVKLHQFTASTPGDWTYALLEGADDYADVRLGRIPVTDEAEADVVLAKLARYDELQRGGYSNKRVLLVAHKENFPEKYTANHERVRVAANPRGFTFTTQYGGARAVNQSVLTEMNRGHAIVAYRGHGSDTTWIGWAYDDKSFGAPEVRALNNGDERLPVVLNVACDTGAVHKEPASQAEELLLHAGGGAVGILGATVPSFTEMNNRFNEYLFQALGRETDISLGNVLAVANNRLVRDSGGVMPANVKMYIWFGDPMLRPWVE